MQNYGLNNSSMIHIQLKNMMYRFQTINGVYSNKGSHHALFWEVSQKNISPTENMT